MIFSDFLKNPLTYWMRWIINKNVFLYKNGKKNIKIDYMSHITHSTMDEFSTLYQNVRVHNSEIGSYSYISNHSTLIGVSVGKFCSIGPNCRIGLGVHPSQDFVSTHPIFFSSQSHVGVNFTTENYLDEFENISIGNDVWIGANVLIKDGVTIANGAIIGANAMVTKDVPAYAIVAGNPAKLIRYRFNEQEIKYLQDYKWWNKDINELKLNYLKYHHINDFMEQ